MLCSEAWSLNRAGHLGEQSCKIGIQSWVGLGLRVLRHVVARHCTEQL